MNQPSTPLKRIGDVAHISLVIALVLAPIRPMPSADAPAGCVLGNKRPGAVCKAIR